MAGAIEQMQPLTVDAASQAGWAQIEPHYRALRQASLSEDSVERWLADWSSLAATLAEASEYAYFRYAQDTRLKQWEEAYLRLSGEVLPQAKEQDVALSNRLLELGWSRPGLETMLRRLGNQRDVFAAANVPLESRLQGLSAGYEKLSGSMMVEWEGELQTVPQVWSRLEDRERDVRERAFRAVLAEYAKRGADFHRIFDQMYALRQQQARNAGFDNFRDYSHQAKDRFDYTSADCLRWHDSVRVSVLPALARIRQARRETMGLPALRPWDLIADPTGLPARRPFESTDQLVQGAMRVFSQLEPTFAAQFARMRDADLLDLESREGKAPGGFESDLPVRELTLILFSAVGRDEDVRTLFHEAGHAFHGFASFAIQPFFQRQVGMEVAELASMSMELLALPYLAAVGGFYSEQDAGRAHGRFLETLLARLAYVASVDAMQQWIYTNPDGADGAKRDAKWIAIHQEFDPEVDWSGLDAEQTARWHYQPHPYTSPFYYIEYGLAQLGALQVWRNARQDEREALEKYRAALALGATRSMIEVYAAAGAQLVFDPDTMGGLVAMVESEWLRLRSSV